MIWEPNETHFFCEFILTLVVGRERFTPDTDPRTPIPKTTPKPYNGTRLPCLAVIPTASEPCLVFGVRI